MRSSWLLMLAAPLLLAGAGRAETLQQVLKAPHSQRVYDFAGVLSPAAEAKLRSRIRGMEQRHVAQGAVILVHRIEGGSIESFANKVLNRWGVGERGRNNGFVLLAAIDQHKWRLETGTGLEKKIPDADAAQLMRSAIVPAFRRKQYAAGLDAALAALQKRASSSSSVSATASSGARTTSAPAVADPEPGSDNGSSGFPGWLLALAAVPILILATLFGGRNRGWGGYGNGNPWWNNGMNSFNSSSNSSNSSSSASSSSSGSSSSSSGDYGGGSGSGGGASGSW